MTINHRGKTTPSSTGGSFAPFMHGHADIDLSDHDAAQSPTAPCPQCGAPGMPHIGGGKILPGIRCSSCGGCTRELEISNEDFVDTGDFRYVYLGVDGEISGFDQHGSQMMRLGVEDSDWPERAAEFGVDRDMVQAALHRAVAGPYAGAQQSPTPRSTPMDTFAAQVGQRYVRDGKAYQVTRITPAGAMGRRVSDGPVVHLRAVCEDGTLSQVSHDVWSGSLSYPASAYEVDQAGTRSRSTACPSCSSDKPGVRLTSWEYQTVPCFDDWHNQ